MTTRTPEEVAAAVINAHILDGALYNPKLVAALTALIQERERMAREKAIEECALESDAEWRRLVKLNGSSSEERRRIHAMYHAVRDVSDRIRALTASPSPSSNRGDT